MDSGFVVWILLLLPGDMANHLPSGHAARRKPISRVPQTASLREQVLREAKFIEAAPQFHPVVVTCSKDQISPPH